MVNVQVKRKDQQIHEILISGHAEFKVAGEDIVCAGISSIVFGMINAIDQMFEDACDINLGENKIIIKVNKTSENLFSILAAMIIQLECVEESYKDKIKIKQ